MSPTRFLSGIILLTAFVPPLAASANLTRISFAQESWYDPSGNLYAPHSLVGRVVLSYVPDPTQTNFLNIAAYLPGQSSPAWIVGNLPLFPGASPASLSLNFDFGQLGIDSGTPVTILYIAATVGPTVRADAPAGPFTAYRVENVQQAAWSDVGAGVGADSGPLPSPLPDPGPVLGLMILSPELYTVSSDRSIRPVQEGRLQCFPGSTARSLDWLNRENNLRINKTVEQFYTDLSNMIGPIANDRNFPTSAAKCTEQIRRKDAYARATFNGAMTIQTKVYTQLAGISPINGVDITTPRDVDMLEWMIGEMQAGEDIELAYWRTTPGGSTIGLHIVTVVGLYTSRDGTIRVRYRDDEVQGDPNRGDSVVKDAPLFFQNGRWRFNMFRTEVFYLMSESPVRNPNVPPRR
jgi:hypothetical protein